MYFLKKSSLTEHLSKNNLTEAQYAEELLDHRYLISFEDQCGFIAWYIPQPPYNNPNKVFDKLGFFYDLKVAINFVQKACLEMNGYDYDLVDKTEEPKLNDTFLGYRGNAGWELCGDSPESWVFKRAKGFDEKAVKPSFEGFQEWRKEISDIFQKEGLHEFIFSGFEEMYRNGYSPIDAFKAATEKG